MRDCALAVALQRVRLQARQARGEGALAGAEVTIERIEACGELLPEGRGGK